MLRSLSPPRFYSFFISGQKKNPEGCKLPHRAVVFVILLLLCFCFCFLNWIYFPFYLSEMPGGRGRKSEHLGRRILDNSYSRMAPLPSPAWFSYLIKNSKIFTPINSSDCSPFPTPSPTPRVREMGAVPGCLCVILYKQGSC